MTTSELHILFRIGVNKINTNKNKGFLPEEIDIIINSQVIESIAKILNAASNPRNEGYEDSMYRLDMIQDKVVNISTSDSPALITLSSFSLGSKITLPSDYYSLVGSTSSSATVCATYSNKPNRLYKSGKELSLALNDYYSRSDMDSPITEVRGGILYIYTYNKFTITEFSMQYISELPVLDYNTTETLPFSDSFWKLVIDNSVMYAKAQSSGNYQIMSNETIKNE